MGGESVAPSVLQRLQHAPQPGGRDPAPGDLALLQAFLNSHFDLVHEWGRDLLATPAGLAEWLGAHDLAQPPGAANAPAPSPSRAPAPAHATPTPAEHARALAVREGLRALAAANADPRPTAPAVAALHLATADLRLRPVLTPHGATLEPVGEGLDHALAALLAIATRAMLTGTWARLKACPGEHCGWAFYDHSRNNSGRWCSMAVCGGRAKARAHYHRTRAR